MGKQVCLGNISLDRTLSTMTLQTFGLDSGLWGNGLVSGIPTGCQWHPSPQL